MKLEIDIDEDYYKIICKRVEENKPYHSPYEYEVIADGKPLEQESILDMIRTEIEFEVDHRTNMLCAEDVFAILDKYKKMRMTFEQFEYKLSELRNKCIKYIKDGCCKYTDCRECGYKNICEEREVED